jgi:predicted nucleic acid-binding protein
LLSIRRQEQGAKSFYAEVSNMVCLDTSFIVDFLRGSPGAVDYLAALEKGSEAITTSAATVFELIEAAELSCSEKEKPGIRELVSSLTVLALDSRTAWAAGELSASLIRSGRQIGLMDTLIGAIALSNCETLVTRNARHFSRIPGLVVEDYA